MYSEQSSIVEVERIILIGGGGHCKSAIDVIRLENRYSIEGILDVSAKMGSELLGIPFIGTDEEIERFARKGFSFLITIGHAECSESRRRLYEKVKGIGGRLAIVISPRSYVSKDTIIGDGTVVFHHALVNTTAIVRENVIINSGSIIEHDAVISSNVHISTQSVVNGKCEVGNGTFVGSGAIIKHKVKIGENCIIGAGAVVHQNTLDNALYVGVPARLKRMLI